MTSRPTSLPPATDTSSISCWTKFNKSDGCARLKEITLTAIEAISSLIVIWAVLVITAQQFGYANDIASLLSPEMANLVLASSVLVLLSSTVLMVSLTRSYLNQKYNEKELKNLGIWDRVHSSSQFKEMPCNSFWYVPQDSVPATEHDPYKPAAYTVLVKGDTHKETLIYSFKTPEDASYFIEQKKREDYVNAEKLYQKRHDHEEAFMKDQFGVDFVTRARAWKEAPLRSGHYIIETLTANGEKIDGKPVVRIEVIVANCGDPGHPNIELRYPKAGQISQLLALHYSGFINAKEAEEAVAAAERVTVKGEVGKRQYWLFKPQLPSTRRDLYAIVYTLSSKAGPTTRYFATREERDHFMQQKGMFTNRWSDAAGLFKKSHSYSVKYVRENADPTKMEEVGQRAQEMGFTSLKMWQWKTQNRFTP